MKKTVLSLVLAAVALTGAGADNTAKPAGAAPAKAAASLPIVSLANARRFISRVIRSPKAMTTVMKRLSAEDQKKFVAEVNQAVSSRPSSPEQKAALFLNVNRAALKGAQPGNLADLLAEVFATVPPESLTLINERFAEDLFNRAANPAVTYTDDQFTNIAVTVMKKVVARNASADNSAVRDAFAALMFVRASNGSPAGLAENLTELISAEYRDDARSEWLPSALKTGEAKSYEPMLGTADAEEQPDIEQALVVAGPQMLDALLEDLTGASTSYGAASQQRNPVVDAITSELQYFLPTGSGAAGGGFEQVFPPGGESGGYPWQSTK
jgi:hypothetical protein